MQAVTGDILANGLDINRSAVAPIRVVLKRRKKGALIAFSLVFVLATAVTMLLPAIYRSAATILIEQQEIPQDFVRSTVTTFADQRIELISQRVMTSSNLWDIIKKYNLYEDKKDSETREEIIERLRNDIKKQMLSADVMDPRSGRPVQATIAFKLSYDSKSPVLAQKVANELTSLYLDENLKSREELAGQANTFLQDEAEKLRLNISESEARIAEFKQKNDGLLPEMLQYNLQAAERAERDLGEYERQMSLVNNRITSLKADLGKLTPQSIIVSDAGERVLSPQGRLKYAESQYASLSATYAPTHPDVVRAKRELEALRSKVGSVDVSQDLAEKRIVLETELAEAKKKYSDDHPDVKRLIAQLRQQEVDPGYAAQSIRTITNADNPVWIQLNTELQASLDELKSLRQRREETKQQVELYRGRIANAPGVEKQYRDLMLDYDNSVHKYQETRNKQMEAQLAQSLEAERKGERLTLVEPPLLPEKAVKPNRLAIFFLGVMLALGAAISAAFIVEKNDDTMWGRDSVYSAVGVAPLAVIPFIEVSAESEKIKQQRILMLVGLAGLFVVALIGIHVAVKPLDVIWFILARKFGL